MGTSNDFSNMIEEEISKQLKEFDKRVDRTGWPLLIVGVIALFLLVYLFSTVFSFPTNEEYTDSQQALTQRIADLEERVEYLELQTESSE